MMVWFFSLLMQVIGFGVVVAEIFIPSMGILSLISMIFFGASLYVIYTEISFAAGIVITVLDLLMVPVLLVIGMKMLSGSRLSLHKELSRSQGVVSQNPDATSLLSQTGKAITDLRPSGSAMVGTHRLDVVTDGEYVERGAPVRVIEVTGNRIVVAPAELNE